jgi:hypothetical protein
MPPLEVFQSLSVRGFSKRFPGQDIYIIHNLNFARFNLQTGSPVCADPQPHLLYSDVLGTPDGVFTSFENTVSRFNGDCSFESVFDTERGQIILRAADHGRIFAIDYPVSPYDPNQTRLLAISSSGQLLWRDSRILVDYVRSIRALKNSVLYVLGTRRTATRASSSCSMEQPATSLNSIETTPACLSCGVAVADDGTIYLNDLNSTKIYRLN